MQCLNRVPLSRAASISFVKSASFPAREKQTSLSSVNHSIKIKEAYCVNTGSCVQHQAMGTMKYLQHSKTGHEQTIYTEINVSLHESVSGPMFSPFLCVADRVEVIMLIIILKIILRISIAAFIFNGEVSQSHPQCLVRSHCKMKHLLFLYCISDNVTAGGVLAAVINCTCRYHGNHRICQIN